jgi:hypothetical protein
MISSLQFESTSAKPISKGVEQIKKNEKDIEKATRFCKCRYPGTGAYLIKISCCHYEKECL